MKQFSIILFLFIPLLLRLSPLQAQKAKLNTYYDKEKTILKEVYQVNDSVLSGEYKQFHRSGELKVKGRYKNNKAVGIWEYYYPNGQMRMTGELRNNSNYGPWVYYYENGSKNMEGKILNGLRQGIWKFYYKDGALRNEGLFVNNKRSGHWKYYFPKGGLKAEANYKRGRGLYTEYYPSGKKHMEGVKLEGKNEGNWSFYYENGKLQAIGDYDDGERVGFWQYFFPDGAVSTEGYYDNDRENGDWVYYHQNGNVSSKGILRDGKRDGYWGIFLESGILKGEGEFQNGEGEYKEYYDDETLKIVGKIIDGKKNGKWTYYYKTGEIEGECIYKDDLGRYVGYYKDGNKKMSGNMDDDIMIGLWELYEPEGSLAGYYKPFYDEDGPVFTLEETKSAGKAPSEWKERRISEFRFKKKKFTPFKPKLNEFKGVVVAWNPFAVFLNRFPISVEYYIQERLGHELQVIVIRKPFFSKQNSIPINENHRQGYSLSLRQKFYMPKQDYGMFYFGSELRYTYLDHSANVLDMNDPPNSAVIGADEDRFEFSAIIGQRFVKETNANGFTVDVFGGVGTGYRNFRKDYPSTPENEEAFEDIAQGKVPLALRFGVNIGYVFGLRRR